MSFRQVEVAVVEQLVQATTGLVTTGVTVNMMGSCVTEGVTEWASGGQGRRLVSNSIIYSERDIGLETEDDSEDIEDDEEDLDMHLEGGEATGYMKSSCSLLTLRSRGAWCWSMITSLMALLTISDWPRVSRRKSNWSSMLTVNMMLAVLVLAW